MRKVLLFTCLLTACSAISQTAGYLGNRFYLKADLGLTMSVGPTAANRGFSQDALYGNGNSGFALSHQYGVQAGFAYARHRAVLLEYHQYETGMKSTASTNEVNDPVRSGGYDNHELFYSLKSRSAGMGWQFFVLNKGSLAPFGNFLSLYLNWHFVSGDIIDKRTQYSSPSAPKFHGNLGFEPKTSFAFGGAGIGQNFILFDRVMLGYEWRFNLPFRLLEISSNGFLPNKSNSLFDTEPEVYNFREFENDAFKRTFQHNLFYYKIGVGLLLF